MSKQKGQKIRIVTRSVIYKGKKLLLVKNEGADFWYPPGGEWEHDQENIKEATVREAKEETGLKVSVDKLLYVQEFHPEEAEVIFFEIFWLAEPLADEELVKKQSIQDPDGIVETAQWFSQKEIQDLRVFPEVLKERFWKDKEIDREDPFIGVN